MTTSAARRLRRASKVAPAVSAEPKVESYPLTPAERSNFQGILARRREVVESANRALALVEQDGNAFKDALAERLGFDSGRIDSELLIDLRDFTLKTASAAMSPLPQHATP